MCSRGDGSCGRIVLHAGACVEFCVRRRRLAVFVCRNLRKKLAKIDLAKEKEAKGDTLTPEQQASVESEAGVRDEMRSLGATDV